MIHRVKEIQQDIPMTVLFGSRSWMDTNSGYTIKYLRGKSYVDVQIIKGAGHHVYADRPAEFNQCVVEVCDKVEQDSDAVHMDNSNDFFHSDFQSDETDTTEDQT